MRLPWRNRRETDEPTDLVAYVVADYCTDGSRGNDAKNIELMARASVNRSRNEYSFAGQWNTHAFQANEDKHGPIAVSRNPCRGIKMQIHERI
jgi:hypothetical protein